MMTMMVYLKVSSGRRARPHRYVVAARKWQEAIRNQTRRAPTQHIEQPDICQISGPVFGQEVYAPQSNLGDDGRRQQEATRDRTRRARTPRPTTTAMSSLRTRKSAVPNSSNGGAKRTSSTSKLSKPTKDARKSRSTTASRNGSARATPTSPRPTLSPRAPCPRSPLPSAPELDSDSELV